MRVALISLEPWDEVWRRNQHLSVELVAKGLAEHVLFVEPPLLTAARGSVREVNEGVTAIRPSLRVPKRLGGLALAGALLRSTVLRNVDVLWINDAVLGVRCLDPAVPALYDVTDDWREFDFPARILRRLVRAEDRLARTVGTVVCGTVLQQRWRERYGVSAVVVHNGVDADLWKRAVPRGLPGAAPHVGYVGTLHEERLDVDLVLRVADDPRIGRVHLVGPDALGAAARERLLAHPHVELHGAVSAEQVPSWTKAMDVLVSPHLVTPFTLSLDAIKSYEYLSSGRPVVATPTSGFQLLTAGSLSLASPADFPDRVAAAAGAALPDPELSEHSWASRARQFGALLEAAVSGRDTRGRDVHV